MNHSKKTDIKLKFLSLFVISLFFSCTNPSTKVTEKPTIKDFTIGEKWTWKWQRTVEGKVRAEGVDTKEVVDYKGDLGFYYVNSRKDTVKAATVLNSKQSKTPFRDWPLKVGKKWKHIENWENESGGKGKTSRDAEVVSFEKLAVKAGTFWAYKIKYDGVMENLATGGKASVIDYWWFCPDLKDYIKHTQDDGYGEYTSELIKYSGPTKN